MNKQTYIYVLGNILGPYERWEIKLLATKYRDFQIFIGNGNWVPFKKWDKQMPCHIIDTTLPLPPSNYMKNTTKIKRYVKRIIFKDHH